VRFTIHYRLPLKKRSEYESVHFVNVVNIMERRTTPDTPLPDQEHIGMPQDGTGAGYP